MVLAVMLNHRRLGVRTAIAAIFLLGLASQAFAGGTYVHVDSEGVTHLTDAPAEPALAGTAGTSGTAQAWLNASTSRGSRWVTEIEEIAARHGVDPQLVHAVIGVESSFNPWAVSPKGAQGLMQLMPRTASALGVRDSFNPRDNIDGGVRYLRYLLDRYPGDLSLALAAYNAGEGAVAQYGGIPPYPETQQYVRKVLQRGTSADAVAPRGAPVQAIYRSEDAEGTVTFSNVPPVSQLRVSQIRKGR